MGNSESSYKPKTDEQKKAMTVPYVAGKGPAIVNLQPGKEYLYCTCGLSNKQPFCDWSHVGTKFSPILIEGKKRKVSDPLKLCVCKQSGTMPRCDGSHQSLQF